ARAQKALAQLPQDDAPAIVVFSKDGGLEGADLGALGEWSKSVGEEMGLEVSPPVPAEDMSAALVAVPLDAEIGSEQARAGVEKLRDLSREDLPEGVKAEVTGAPAVQADLGAVFEGADIRL